MKQAQRQLVFPIFSFLLAILVSLGSAALERLPHAGGFFPALLAWLPLTERVLAQEPLYERRALSEWQSDLGDMSLGTRLKAVEALGHFGPPAIPHLMRALKDPDPIVQDATIKALTKIGSVAVPALTRVIANDKEEPRIVSDAIRVLENLGPEAKDAVPELTIALSKPQLSRAAADALTKIGPPAVPALADALIRGLPTVQWLAKMALAKIGPAAVPALVRTLKETSTDVRQSAAEALGEMGPKARDAVPALIQAISDASPQVRWSAAARSVTSGSRRKKQLRFCSRRLRTRIRM